MPPLASAIHQTYSAIAKPQATGISTPQTPIPLMNSHAIATTSVSNSASEMPKPIHHQRGACGRSTRPLTSSLSERRVTLGSTTGASLGRSMTVHAFSLSIAGLGLRITAA